jgi:protein SCO1
MRPFQPLLPLLLAFWLAACSDAPPPGGGLAAPPGGGDFVLQSADGPVDSRSLRGKVMLVYFGYTHCPDICPASMSAGAQALNALSAEERKKVKLLMISVDPERDTLAGLKTYAAFFHPEMVGVTGSPAEIEAVAKAFGAGYLKQPADADGRYAVDHTALTYVVGPDGKMAALLQLGTPTETVVATIRKLLP